MIVYLDTSSLVKLYVKEIHFEIHLASVVHLKNKIKSEIYFSSHDTRLNQSAKKEGMIIVS